MIVRAGWVCPVSAAPIRDGWVAIDGERISAVGCWTEAASEGTPAGARAEADIHLSDCVLTPGLVNPHTHLELTCYAGRIAPAPFWPWVAKLLPLRRAPDQLERERAAVADGAWRSLCAGVTCVGDISRTNLAWRALKQIPIRKVCFVELLSIADQPPRTLDELRVAVREVEEDGLLRVGVSPHASYSVPLIAAQECVNYAARIDRPWTMHLAELPEEIDFLAGRVHATPTAIQELMTRHGVESPRIPAGEYAERLYDAGGAGTIAHGNYLTDMDFRRIAATQVATIYCPGAHAYFGHPPHPFTALERAGARVCLGTDSAASQISDRLSILDEIRLARRRTDSGRTPEQWLKLCTADAANALGLADVIGTIEPGKFADLAAFRIDPATPDPVGALLDPAGPVGAAWTMVAGTPVLPMSKQLIASRC